MLALENDSGWDRTFLRLSSLASEPFCAAYGLLRYRLVGPLDPQEFDNCSTKTMEVAVRAFIALTALAAVALCVIFPIVAAITLISAVTLFIASKVLRAIGFALQQKEGFTHVKGNLEPQRLAAELKVGTYNICGIAAEMPKDHGGVNDWKPPRVDTIVDIIREANADVFVLQEVYDNLLAEALIERLKDEYCDFYIHLGPNPICGKHLKDLLGTSSGVIVFSKLKTSHFYNETYLNKSWQLNRNFAKIEILADPDDKDAVCARVIGTHSQYGNDEKAKQMRMEEVAQITDHLAKQTLPLPTIFAGDLNIELNSEEYRQTLAPVLHPGYDGTKGPTCTGKLVAKWYQKPPEPDETIDYVSLFKHRLDNGRTLHSVIDQDVRLEDHTLYKSYDENYNTKTAASDHNCLTATLRWYDKNGKQISPQEWSKAQRAILA